jgi:hypothetical protein
MMLAACAAPATVAPTDSPTLAPTTPPATPLPTSGPEPTQIQVDRTPAQLAALQDLAAALNLPVGQIVLASSEAVEWPDGCLGVHLPNVMCTQSIVPGFRITLVADGQTYEYHTNQDGSVVVNATSPLRTLHVAVLAPDKSIQLIDTGLAAGSATAGLPPFGGATDSAVYALDFGMTATAIEAGLSGTRTLDFIQNPSYGLAVWPGNGEAPLLAWATATGSTSPTTDLHVSRPDGTASEVVVREVVGPELPPYQLVALGWSADGSALYYSREPYGIGGYILFTGASSLYRYSASDQSVTEIMPFEPQTNFLCLDDLSADGNLLADHCNETIHVRDLAGGATTTITPPADAAGWAALGTARLSPDNSRVAFALARQDPEAEQGWVAVSDGLDGSSTLVLTSEPGKYYNVVGWLNADTLLVQLTSLANCSVACESSLWTVGTDGLNPTRLAEGTFVAFVGN